MGHDYCHRHERLCSHNCPDCSSNSNLDECRSMTHENIFGKTKGRFDEGAALKDQRSLVDQFTWAFAAMPDEMKHQAMLQFNQMFAHPHCPVKFHIEAAP
jgi:hypothetical protein